VSDDSKQALRWILDAVWGVLSVLLLGASGWLFTQVVDLRSDLEALKAESRALHAESDRRFSDISLALKDINAKLDRLVEQKGRLQ
jgi:hypothetical protein